ncbi:hypothetical protein AWZ03_005524 [Drosophila navojoa]|uniref:Uncharacterized protein n=1 Tax=Drosophila navojoa TaxID=7232 RepID=A0A484BH68_DRONA|nr:uncharacterized protein LOC108652359 [Drosophila navojoa]TDG48107.1 hypothetical protein AWZ03_005524 [Drosophila navojoa]
MFKLSAALFVLCAVLACSLAEAKPAVLVDAAPAVVTATSSQYVARNFNGIAAAPIVAAAAAYTAPIAAAPVSSAAYTAPLAYPYSYPYTAAYTTYL